jgi:hypothetical protein
MAAASNEKNISTNTYLLSENKTRPILPADLTQPKSNRAMGTP